MWSAISSRVIFGLLMAMAAIGWAQPALAGTFPEKPVPLIVSWPAGGGTEVSGRPAPKFAEGPLGHAIVVVNKPGGGGVVGTLEVERVNLTSTPNRLFGGLGACNPLIRTRRGT